MQNELQKVPLLLVKDFLENLKLCKNMVIVFTAHPSVCLEYRNNRYCISITYMDVKSYQFEDSMEMYKIFVRYCCSDARRTIFRIELNSARSTGILYGPMYEYERQYIAQTIKPMHLGNIIEWC